MKHFKILRRILKPQTLLVSMLFFGSFAVQSQPLTKAPVLTKKKVKQIIEWIRLDFDQKAKEGAVSGFDKKGNLNCLF